MTDKDAINKKSISHRFLDEAGDTTFFGKGRIPIIGQRGVSLSFSIGMVKFSEDLASLRARVRELQKQIAEDRYLNVIPSVAKKIQNRGFFFHATDDPPEVREIFFKFIDQLDCSIEVMVGRKIPQLFITKHNGKDAEFYADLLSHLLKNKLRMNGELVLKIASRANTTMNSNLEAALSKAVERHSKKYDPSQISSKVVFDVQNHHTEPLLNVADYLCWAVQRVFEKGETRYYDFLGEKFSLVVDLYDSASYEGSKNYYSKRNPLTPVQKLSPPSP